MAHESPKWVFTEEDPEEITGANVEVSLRLKFSRDDEGVTSADILLDDDPVVSGQLAEEIAGIVLTRLELLELQDPDSIVIETKQPPQVA